MVRVSPGSPSQWIATCSPCPAVTCRSTQFTATFNSPSANHFACGASDQSSTWVNGVAQVNRFACSAQNASGSAAARSYASAVRFAFAANSADGGNVRSSVPKLSNATAPFPGVGVTGCDVLAGPLIGLLLDDGDVVVKLRPAASPGPGCDRVACRPPADDVFRRYRRGLIDATTGRWAAAELRRTAPSCGQRPSCGPPPPWPVVRRRP